MTKSGSSGLLSNKVAVVTSAARGWKKYMEHVEWEPYMGWMDCKPYLDRVEHLRQLARLVMHRTLHGTLVSPITIR